MTTDVQPTRIAKKIRPNRPARPAIGAELSEDRKLQAFKPRDREWLPISATHVSQYSCEPTCPLLPTNICYVAQGPMGFVTGLLNASGPATPLALAQAEAAEIDRLSGRSPLRLRVVGDMTTNEAAQVEAAAVERYQARGGQPVFGYTHAWRNVDRASFGPSSILASCETEQDVAVALERGYATAIEWDNETPLPLKLAGTKVIFCPQQAHTKADCAHCMICAKDEILRGKATIAFKAHGTSAKRMGVMLRARREAAAAEAAVPVAA